MVEKSINLRKLSDEGYIGLTIRAWDTEYNESIHKAFKDFCKEEYRNDYTLGLKALLDAYDTCRQVGSLWKVINDLDERLSLLEDSFNESSGESEVVREDDIDKVDGVF